jgi:hypothetical protein
MLKVNVQVGNIDAWLHSHQDVVNPSSNQLQGMPAQDVLVPWAVWLVCVCLVGSLYGRPKWGAHALTVHVSGVRVGLSGTHHGWWHLCLPRGCSCS